MSLQEKMAMAYQLGTKHAALTYNPQYSREGIRAIRDYNRDVSSGRSNWSAAAGLAAGAGEGLRRSGNWKGALGGALLGGVLGKGLGYGVSRFNQGIDNYLHTDVNWQNPRN